MRYSSARSALFLFALLHGDSRRPMRMFVHPLLPSLSSSSSTTRVTFLSQSQRHERHQRHAPFPRTTTTSTTALQMSGSGIATNYTWKEEAYELDVTVRVPFHTRAKDIRFRAQAQSIDLQLLVTENDSESADGTKAASSSWKTLLDPTRKLRGRVNLDGTYWVISDADNDKNNNENKYRTVTVTIEKIIQTPKDDFQVVDYDWKGVYAVEDVDEVSERTYDGPEPLDVRDYAARMGVDIDNIDMSKVDKSMFNSGMNVSTSALDELSKAGYLAGQQVTQQADGSEYVVNEDGEPVPYSPVEGVAAAAASPPPIPFLDTESPWDQQHKHNETFVQQTRNFTRAAFAKDSAVSGAADNPYAKTESSASNQKQQQDPIDLLTVKRLKEILKSQGIKSSGTKKELQDRLRAQVNSLLQGNQPSEVKEKGE